MNFWAFQNCTFPPDKLIATLVYSFEHCGSTSKLIYTMWFVNVGFACVKITDTNLNKGFG